MRTSRPHPRGSGVASDRLFDASETLAYPVDSPCPLKEGDIKDLKDFKDLKNLKNFKFF